MSGCKSAFFFSVEKRLIEDSNASVNVFEVNEIHISVHAFKVTVEDFGNGENHRRIIGILAVIILEIIEFEDDVYVGIVLLVLDVEIGNRLHIEVKRNIVDRVCHFFGREEAVSRTVYLTAQTCCDTAAEKLVDREKHRISDLSSAEERCCTLV